MTKRQSKSRRTAKKTRHLDLRGVEVEEVVDSPEHPLFFRLPNGTEGALFRGEVYLRPADVFGTITAKIKKELQGVSGRIYVVDSAAHDDVEHVSPPLGSGQPSR
jgi:hypothetical protein